MIPMLLIELSSDPIYIYAPQLVWAMIIAGVTYVLLWRFGLFNE